jgi:hypothetical protein
MSDAQLLQQQNNMMAGKSQFMFAIYFLDFEEIRLTRSCVPFTEQDRMLEQISKGVGNLHQYGKVIGEEANLHVALLDNLDSDVDKAHVGLSAETAHADKVIQEYNYNALSA